MKNGRLNALQLDRMLRAAKPIAGVSDGGGLTFTLSSSGTAAWILRYRIGGRPRELTLGRYPSLSLHDARKAALQARARVSGGEDVATAKRRRNRLKATSGQVRELVDDYLTTAGPDLAVNTLRETRRMLQKDAIPTLGAMLSVDVRPEDIVETISRTATRSKTVARRIFEMLSVVFSHGVAKRIVPTNPCVGLRVSAIIGTPKPVRQGVMLSQEELKAVWGLLPSLGRSNELAIKIILATCVRKGALLLATWNEIDLERAVWTVPGAPGRKSDKDHRIPMAPSVVAWFRELKLLSGGSPFVLPGRAVRYGKVRESLSHGALNVALQRLQAGTRPFSPHDLRKTARSYLAQLGVDIVVAERCLNHSLGGLVGVYDIHDYFEERRVALEKWAAFLESNGAVRSVEATAQAA